MNYNYELIQLKLELRLLIFIKNTKIVSETSHADQDMKNQRC